MRKKYNLEEISAEKGAYILQVTVSKSIVVDIKSLKNPQIKTGRYLYCGSANGPGGIRARVLRHIKRDKKPHWHMDRLTIPFGVEAISVFEGGSECDLVKRLLQSGLVLQPYEGFGSSDCNKCKTHLLCLQGSAQLEDCGFTAPIFRPEPDIVF